jgi:predicted lactoylglutathione lyase
MPKTFFVNLPVKGLAAATRLTHDYFATFTPKPLAHAQKTSEVLICLSRDSRE